MEVTSSYLLTFSSKSQKGVHFFKDSFYACVIAVIIALCFNSMGYRPPKYQETFDG